jgi:hypothetical protein
MNKFILLIVSFLLFSCGEAPIEEEHITEEEKIKISKIEKHNNKDENKKNITYELNKINSITLNDNDQVSISKEQEIIKIEYKKNNKNKYFINYYELNEILILSFEKVKFVSTLSNNLDYLNIVNLYYIKNDLNRYQVKNVDKNNEINIDNYSSLYEYSNISNVKIKNNGTYNLVNVNLLNKKHCNKNNGIIVSKNKINETIISLKNEKINNLICGKENIYLTKSNYLFSDDRNFNLFDKTEIVTNKINQLKNKLTKNNPIELYKDNNNYILEINNTTTENYSFDYKYHKQNKTLTIYFNSVPDKWLVVDKLVFNEDVFVKIQDIEIIENKFNNYNKNNIIKKENDKLNIEKIYFNNGKEYSYLNGLSCNYFNNSSEIFIEDFNKKGELHIMSGNNNKRCNLFSTQKMALNIFNFNIKNKKYIQNNTFLKKYLNIVRKNDYYLIEGNNEYNLYDYREINNQLYLYVDKDINKDYIIINEKINKLKIDQYNNINIVDLSKDNNFKNILKKEYKVYRDYKESIKSNIRILTDKNQKYYTIRFNSVYLDNKFKKCNNKLDYFEKHKDNEHSFTFYIKNKDYKCDKVGVELYIYKVIGNKIDVEFLKQRKKDYLNDVSKKHDEQKHRFNEAIKHSFIDFDFEVFFHNNERYFLFNFKELNKKSLFNNELSIKIEGDKITIEVQETKDFVNNKTFYKILKTNKNISEFKIKLNEIGGNIKNINYKLGE